MKNILMLVILVAANSALANALELEEINAKNIAELSADSGIAALPVPSEPAKAETGEDGRQVVAVCGKVINQNVGGNAKDTLVSAGEVKLVRNAAGYYINYDYSQLKFAGHGSILALDSGCTFTEGHTTLAKCQETAGGLKLGQRFSPNNMRISAFFDKAALTLRVTHTEGGLFRKILSDAVLQCRAPEAVR